MKSWAVETSLDGRRWREVACEKNETRLKGRYFAGTFSVAGGRECRFIRLVNIGRNHMEDDCLWITAWEIFGDLVEDIPERSSYTADFSGSSHGIQSGTDSCLIK
jgi:hypothetical protein